MADPLAIDPYAEDQAYLDSLRPSTEPYVPQTFQGSPLEHFQGLETMQLPAPRSVGQGFLEGLTHQIGAAGSRIAQARQKFENAQVARQAAFDAERRQASRDYRLESGRVRRERIKAESDQRKERQKYLDSTLALTQEDIAANPALGRVADSEGRVPREWLKPAAGAKSLDQIRAEAKARAQGTAEGAGDMVPDLSEEAQNGVADAYANGMGNAAIPPGGRGKERQAFVTKIVNKAFERNPGANLALSQADYKVAKQELGKFQTARDLFDTAGKQVDFNIGKASSVIKGLPDAGVTLLNRPLRDAANILGSQKYRQFLVYVNAARREYSKITGSMLPGGVGEVPEGARKQMEPILSDDSTVGQIIAAGEAIKNESQQLVGNFDTHIGEIRGRMQIGNKAAGGAAQAPAPPAPKRIKYDAYGVPVGQ